MKVAEIWRNFAGVIVKTITGLSAIACFFVALLFFPYNGERVEPKLVSTGEIKEFFEVEDVREDEDYYCYESFVVVEADTFQIKSHKDFIDHFCFLEVKDVVNVYTAGTGIGYLSKQEIDLELIIDDVEGNKEFLFWYCFYLGVLCGIMFYFCKNKEQ